MLVSLAKTKSLTEEAFYRCLDYYYLYYYLREHCLVEEEKKLSALANGYGEERVKDALENLFVYFTKAKAEVLV